MRQRDLRKLRIAGVAAFALVASSCGIEGTAEGARPPIQVSVGDSGRGNDSVEVTTTPQQSPSTTPAKRPLSVVLAGDSIMGDTAPAALTALRQADRAVDARFELVPAVPRTLADLERWSGIVEDARPDVVVFLIGVWESLHVQSARGYGTPGWEDRYQTEVLSPWLDWLDSEGIMTVWVGMAPVREPTADARIQETTVQIARAAIDRDEVVFVDAADALTFFGLYTDHLPVDQDRVERVRRVDGLHLCAPGAERLTTLILDAVSDRTGLMISEGWQQGAWRHAVVYDPEAECPEA